MCARALASWESAGLGDDKIEIAPSELGAVKRQSGVRSLSSRRSSANVNVVVEPSDTRPAAAQPDPMQLPARLPTFLHLNAELE